MKYLLDTCTFLWLIAEPERLSGTAKEICATGHNVLLLSAASAWEIALKHALGRLPLPEDPAEYLPRQRIAHDVEALPIDERAALQIGKLPALHRDPFDRMLICQAIAGGFTLVTPDASIRQYPVLLVW
jgi:PIN domain nuclease of toxin-antitoxin system